MQSSSSASVSVAVVGAGIAGLACATELADAGCRVTLFDKGRKPGGRVATRRAEGVSFDHGAQYATARGGAFQALLRAFEAQGVASAWPAAQRGGDTAWIGVPGMSALPAAMADRAIRLGVSIETGRHVAFIQNGRVRHMPADTTRRGTVTDVGGVLSEAFDIVLLALPAPQAAPLLAAVGHSFAAPVEACTIAPCWAVMAHFAAPVPGPDCQREAGGPLGWIARNSGRPGHAREPDAWVLHASHAWSRAHLEATPEFVIENLLEAFDAATGSSARPVHASAHRWRYALVEQPLGQDCLWDPVARIGLCGDWCLGPRMEQAFNSGRALAAAVRA